MKRYLHFYYWLVVAVLMVCSKPALAAQTFTYDQITDGTVVKIYPKGHYGEKNMALACSGNEEYLTSYEKAGSGDLWTLVDAGDGYFYLKNNLGCYWASQGQGWTESLKCALSQSGAVKIKIKYDSEYTGWGFWRHYDFYSSLDRALNNLEGSCYKYNWWSTKDDYDGDSNSTFDIELIQDGTDAIRTVGYLGFNFRLDLQSKTATLVAGDYTSIIASNNGELRVPAAVSYGGNYYQVTAIGRLCFANLFGRYAGLTSVTMPDCVTSIGDNCFSGCVGLTKIILPRNLVTLEDACFSGCSGLTEITLPNGNLRVGNACFSRCSSLANVTLPEGIASLGKSCFEDCSSLTAIALPQSITWLGSNCFANCNGLTNITLPQNITRLDDDCFANCTGLSKITMPEGLVTLGKRCFTACSHLANVTLPESVTTLGESCFKDCGSITNITFPKNVEKLESSLFSGCSSLANVRLHSLMTVLGDSCFYACKTLTNVSFTKYGIAMWISRLGKSCFEGCSSLTNVDILESVTTLGDYCFKDCKQLTNIMLHKGTTWLGAGCFANCSGLTDIVLPESVTTLGARCFANCSNLTKISFPSTLKSIGAKVFDGIDNRIVLSCFASEPPSTETVDVINSNCRVFVPKESLREYRAVSYWQKAYSISILYPSESVVVTPEASIVKTKTTTLESTVLPENAGIKYVWWKSENPDVASVDNNGVVTGVKVGIAKVVATTADGMGLTASSTITVLPLPISDFSSKTLSVPRSIPTKMELDITPSEADNQELKWTSLTPEIATVAEDGTVTGLKLGMAQLKAETTDGSNLSKIFDVEVVGPPISAILLPTESISVVKTKTVKIPATIEPADAVNQKLIWSSSNTDVASVDDNGVVTGKKAGKVRITASATDASKIAASIEVTIEPLKVESMVFAEPKLSIVKTNTYNVILTLNSDQVDNKVMRWTSSDDSVASVKQNVDADNPLEAIVTAHKVGKAIIKAEAQDGSGVSAACEVEVTPLKVSDFSLQTKSVVKTIPTMMEMDFTPSEADNQKLKWMSLTPEIAAVTEDGMVTGLKMGLAKLKAETTDGSNITKTFEVQVNGLLVSTISLPKETSIVKTEEAKLEYSVLPLASDNQTLKWTSDNENVATVTQEGIVKGIHAGTANITAVTMDGSNIAATCKVTVDSLTINPADTVLWIDGTKQLEISPAYAAHNETIWSSSNPAIAKVSENGLVTALAEGEADITATVVVGEGLKAVSHVKVIIPADGINFENSSVQIIDGESRRLNVIFQPTNASIKKLEWTSDNPSIVTVDDEGTIFGVAEGTSVIAAKTTDGSNLTITCEVVVVKGVKVVNLGQLTAGCVIKIYPRGYNNNDFYAQSNMAVACGGDGQKLTSCEEAGAGDLWTLIDAGDGFYYLRNDLGCYWSDPLICTANLEKATKVSLTWNSTFHGVNFWKDGSDLGLYGYNDYRWWASRSESFSDPCATFDIALIESGNKENLRKLVTVNGIDYMLDLLHKTAEVYRNEYSGDVVIPEKISDEGIDYMVTSLSNSCFADCKSLTSVTLPNSIVSIGDKCFFRSSLENIILPDGITSLGEECFKYCSQLANISLPASITSLGESCFEGCEGLKDISLPSGVVSLGYACFFNCKNLTSVKMEDGLTSMGVFCFSSCSNLKHVTISKGLTSLPQACFDYCSSLEDITLPEGITMLDSYCFSNSGLKNITLPSTLEIFGYHVFDDIDNDIIITCKAITPPYNDYFDKVDLVRSNDRLFVPRESLEKYKAHFSWKKAYSINPLYPVASISLPDEVSLEMGKTMTLDYTVLPENAGTKTVAWSSNNPDVASVDENGVVMGRMSGDAIITATATDGTEVSASCKVTVTPSTGIGNITMGDVKLVIKDRHLKVEGLADNDIVQIINTIGFTVYKGTEHEIDLKAAGVYIIKVKGKTLKFSVK